MKVLILFLFIVEFYTNSRDSRLKKYKSSNEKTLVKT